MEGANANDDEFSFRFLNVEMVVRNSTTGEIAKFDKERDLVIIALKFIIKRSHFFKNSSAAVRS